MSDQTDKLKNMWQDARSNDYGQSVDTGNIITMAKQQMKKSIHLQLRTILILLITLMCLAAFFVNVAKLKETISHIGSGLMLGGLAVRIMIECISIYLSNKINLSETALKSNNASLAYFQFRKKINGPVTISIVLLYSIGFYMLSPEFSLYFSETVMIMMDLSYILIAVIFTWFIRMTIKKETNISNEILRIQNDLNSY
ncbi:MAG: hypothetical protein JWP81_4861 [Ferruginibacter sp.]|nr:hypothetical protein [Ferruginibacter sp.]